jgi:hypothetical protein
MLVPVPGKVVTTPPPLGLNPDITFSGHSFLVLKAYGIIPILNPSIGLIIPIYLLG